jgi:hypothetical protein
MTGALVDRPLGFAGLLHEQPAYQLTRILAEASPRKKVILSDIAAGGTQYFYLIWAASGERIPFVFLQKLTKNLNRSARPTARLLEAA